MRGKVLKKKMKSYKKKIEKKFSKREYLLFFLLIISLSAFFHFKEQRFFIYEINSKAPKDIIALQDFSYLDKKQMIIMKQESIVDIGKIFSIKENDLSLIEKDFLRKISNHPDWRKTYPVTYNEMRKLSNKVIGELEKWHFTNRRTYKKREEIGLSVKKYTIIEKVIRDKAIILPNEFWRKLERIVLESNPSYKKEIEFIIGIYRSYRFLLERDHEERIDTERSLYQILPEIYSSISKNDVIVKKGDQITGKEYEKIMAMKATIQKKRDLWSIKKILSSILISLLVVSIGCMYCYVRNPKVLKDINKLTLYIVLILLTCGIAKIVEFTINISPYSVAKYFQYPAIIPFMSILMALFLDEGLALFTSIYLTVIVSFTLALDTDSFIAINIFSGIIASLSSSKLKKRKEIFYVCFKVWCVCALATIIYMFSINALFTQEAIIELVAFGVNVLLISILLVVVIPIIEWLFGIMTNMALMEYVDPTHPLLQRLSLEAPGTYQHSLSIGHIAEYAANAIGANGMLCRVTTLYHDIGKLNNPHYYTENQMLTGTKVFNIHKLLTPIESAYIIKSHILDGKALAKQYNLPKIFVDIILQHHGTTLINYFYYKQLENVDGVEEDVNKKAFRYPGPKPQTKESAIIMLADSIEAASRTLEENTEEAIHAMVEKIILAKFSDGQFEDCNLEFDELAIIKQKFVEIIKATHHLRIKYPEPK